MLPQTGKPSWGSPELSKNRASSLSLGLKGKRRVDAPHRSPPSSPSLLDERVSPHRQAKGQPASCPPTCAQLAGTLTREGQQQKLPSESHWGWLTQPPTARLTQPPTGLLSSSEGTPHHAGPTESPTGRPLWPSLSGLSPTLPAKQTAKNGICILYAKGVIP